MASVLDRIVAKLDIGLCWEWTGAKAKGYGRVNVGDHKIRQVHRVVWECLVGAIRENLELDHMCRNRACCNPDHLDPVTHLVNVQRGPVGTVNSMRFEVTHCSNNHEYTLENSYIYPSGRRECRTCMRDRRREKRVLTHLANLTKEQA